MMKCRNILDAQAKLKYICQSTAVIHMFDRVSNDFESKGIYLHATARHHLIKLAFHHFTPWRA